LHGHLAVERIGSSTACALHLKFEGKPFGRCLTHWIQAMQKSGNHAI
jgi:hypothetical protein